MFNFTPLLGAQSSSPASQSLLEFDGGIKILIDVGWDESFDVAKLKQIEKHASTLSFILLTHATVAHLGGFAHCCKHIPNFTRIPVYATIPVVSLGRTLLQDLYTSTPLASSIIPTDALTDSGYAVSLKDGTNPNMLMQAPTNDEIAHYFASIKSLKYTQPHTPRESPFSPPLGDLTITAYSAGHTLGGTIWHIQHGMESVVYAVDWNSYREHVLSGAAWLGGGTGGAEVLEQLRRPTALVCSCTGSGQAVAAQRNSRDEALLSMVRETVSNGGSVLIPSDSSARVLELAYLLEETWANEPSNTGDSLRSARLYLASRTGGATMRYVRSMLEWMDESIVKESETATGAQEGQDRRRTRGHGGKGDEEKTLRAPFDFRHLQLVERKSKVQRMLDSEGPRVVLASDTTLEWGFSKDAIRSLAHDSRNLIILTERLSPATSQGKGLGAFLYDLWTARSASTNNAPISPDPSDQATIRTIRKFPLEGDELALYQQYLATQRQHQSIAQGEASPLEMLGDVVFDDATSFTSTTSEEESEMGGLQGRLLTAANTTRHARHKLGLTDEELGVNVLIRRKNVHDFDVRGKKGADKMFPFVAKRRRADDFGDVIRPEDYVTAEEQEEQIGAEGLGAAAASNGATKTENAVGQKRKWDEVAARTVEGVRGGVPAKRSRGDREGSQAMADGQEMDDNDEAMASESEGEEEEDADKIEGPAKAIIETSTLQLQARISFVDFSGLHDRRTIQMLLPLIKPRKLILVKGEEAETRELAEECRKALSSGSATDVGVDVFTPLVGDCVDASVDTNAWFVKLSEEMVRKLQWQKVRGLSIVAITGRLEAASLEPTAHDDHEQDKDEGGGGAKKKAKLAASSSAVVVPANRTTEIDGLPVLKALPPNLSKPLRSIAQPFHVGDVRLAELRKRMQAAGMTAEFRGEGTLVVNGTVAVRKVGEGRIEIDGGAYSFVEPRGGSGGGGGIGDGTFFKVRRMVYEGLAVVSGQ
ncbi:uncharacterized protein EI97DRAFT_386439 [Westerdykella ornata]|uniref:Cleavage and polyadenylation specificity factor subunit 2 n=1 Tax=Westerdykella ornata TaxID=318751 RepID=A0A6A6J814_WESOR|nr:uncharacterized protein EI97DRAFT_386439 [Westerdykella ornata]KAF2272138.1 hypothetical protein EI97DRAFT_386439 [Westerdykella ornata]